VFRSDLILAHSSCTGQVNVPDMFTRWIFSLLATGIAPRSFYQSDAAGQRPGAHYDGLPVDFIAEAVTSLGTQVTDEFRSFDVMNPYDDGARWMCSWTGSRRPARRSTESMTTPNGSRGSRRR